MPNLSFPRPVSLPRCARGTSGRFRVVFLGLLAIVLVVTSVKYAAKVAKPGDTGQQSRSAFLRWRTMILDVFTGTNVYVGKNEYPNPPVMAIILRPFAELPPVAGAMAWFYAKVLMAVLAAVWVFRLVSASPRPGSGGVRGKPVADGVKAAAILLALPAIMGDLSHNNVNIFILFLVAACLEPYRRGRDIAAGLVLGLRHRVQGDAAPVPGVLRLEAGLARRRRVRRWAGAVARRRAGAVFGWDRNAELLTDWYKLMVERPVLKGEITTEHPNQALPGFVYRLFTHSPRSSSTRRRRRATSPCRRRSTTSRTSAARRRGWS